MVKAKASFRLRSSGEEAKESSVKWSRAVLGQGQAVKAPFWAVEDLDPGRGPMNRVYGSDHPLHQP